MAAVLTGQREPPHWTGTGRRAHRLWDLKGQFEAAVALAVPGGVVQVEGSGWIAQDSRGRTVGQAGPIEADAPPWAAPLLASSWWSTPLRASQLALSPLPSTPSSERVLALLLREGTSVRQVEELLGRVAAPCSNRF